MDDLFSIPPKDAAAEVTMTEDATKAFIKLTPPMNGGSTLTYDNLIEVLACAGIIYGIKDDDLRQMSAFPEYNKKVLIAEATLPVRGEDSSYKLLFSPSSSQSPQVLEDGTVDFKNLGIVKNVRAGEPLCEKIPAGPGTPGKNVLGQVIAPTPGREKKLPRGKGCVLSDDGNYVLSTMDGQVDFIGDRVSVQNLLRINTDIDYNTGNIDFVGNVMIDGNVLSGFYVKADGNITINGCVDGGNVESGGNMVIMHGINGGGKSRIVSGGDIKAVYIQNAQVEAANKVEACMVMSSKVRCGGNIYIVGKQSRIIASEVTARHLIDCIDVGSGSAHSVSVLEVGVDPVTKARYVEIPKQMAEIQKQLVNVENIVNVFEQLHASGRLDEEKRAQLVKLYSTIQARKQELAELVMEKEEVDQKIQTMGYGTVNVKGTAQPGTRIIMGTEVMVLNQEYKYTLFTRRQSGIVTTPAKG